MMPKHRLAPNNEEIIEEYEVIEEVNEEYFEDVFKSTITS